MPINFFFRKMCLFQSYPNFCMALYVVGVCVKHIFIMNICMLEPQWLAVFTGFMCSLCNFLLFLRVSVFCLRLFASSYIQIEAKKMWKKSIAHGCWIIISDFFSRFNFNAKFCDFKIVLLSHIEFVAFCADDLLFDFTEAVGTVVMVFAYSATFLCTLLYSFRSLIP